MSERIELRVTPEEKTHWQAIAASRGVSLSELIRVALSGQRLRSRRNPHCQSPTSPSGVPFDVAFYYNIMQFKD